MSGFDEPGTTVDEPVKRRSAGSRFGDLGDRLARTFGGGEQTQDEGSTTESNGARVVAETAPPRDRVAPRFPIAPLGYSHAAVNEHVAELERELAELRARTPSVVAEIERIGEQTAEILSLAHEKAQETTRNAQAEADSCVANAASNAIAITEEAKRQLAEIDSETDSVWRERARLIEDVRSVAAALLSLAEDAADRYAAESERGEPAAAEFEAEAEPATAAFEAESEPAEPPTPVFAPDQSD